MADEKRVERAWIEFMVGVIPEDAPDIQIREMKKAFYSGAALTFYGIIGMLDEDKEPTDEDVEKMDGLHKELDTWMAQSGEGGGHARTH